MGVCSRFGGRGVLRVFGDEGDILISLNGSSVQNRTRAISVGRRLWRQGVRHAYTVPHQAWVSIRGHP